MKYFTRLETFKDVETRDRGDEICSGQSFNFSDTLILVQSMKLCMRNISNFKSFKIEAKTMLLPIHI